MSDSITVTDSVRGFSQLIYAETASAIQQIISIEGMPETLQLKTVRVCCGSEKVNKSGEGYALPDDTPWLTELWFGDSIKGARDPDSLDVSSPPLSKLPCKCLQGIGNTWELKLQKAGINTIGQLASLPHTSIIELGQGNLKILDFIAKAKTVNSPPPPIQRTSLDTIKVTEAVWMTSDRISELEPTDWNRITNFLMKLIAALDDSILQKMTLRDVLG